MSPPADAPALLIATGNRGKWREFGEILGAPALALRSLAEFPDVALPEEGDDYRENALAKARAAAAQSGLVALADDSGLEVDALDGRPGVRSARYGGPELDDAGRVERLLAEIGPRPAGERTARFVCVAAIATPGGGECAVRGVCEGRILERPSGGAGFGYDPIFVARGESRSMAELPAEHKNRISHRARALAALRETLERLRP